MWEIIGWVIWGIIALLALYFTFGWRHSISEGESLSWAIGFQTLSFWVIAIVFLFAPWNKLHILWITPVAFIFAQFTTGIVRIPIISPIVLFLTDLFLRLILIGIKKRQ